MLAIPNTTTGATYASASFSLQQPLYSGFITVANNPVIMRFIYGPWSQVQRSPEFYVTPTQFPVQAPRDQPLQGLEFRDAVAGNHAQVFGALFGEHEPVALAGASFTGSVSAGGGVSPGLNTVQFQKDGVLVATESALNVVTVGGLPVTLADNPGATRADLTITPLSWLVGGASAGAERFLNLIAGSGLTIAGVDNPGSTRVDVTLTPVARTLDRSTATTDVQTSVAETSIYSFVVPANTLGTDRLLNLLAIGDYLHNNVAGDTLTMRVKFGGTPFWVATTSLGAAISASREPWSLALRIANLGATNSQMIQGEMFAGRNDLNPTTGIGGFTAVALVNGYIGISTPATIDTTVNQTVDVTVQWSASSANNSWRKRYASLAIK